MSESQSPGHPDPPGQSFPLTPQVVDVMTTGRDPGPLPGERPPPRRTRRLRRTRIPLILFIATCISTFWVGATRWRPDYYFQAGDWRVAILENWNIGLMYMTCVLAILLTHEMGHFIATIRYRIRASLPYFLPIPINAIGTLGAVIAMDGRSADRRQMFDIGLAGPIAGLVVAVPIMWIGVQRLDLTAANPPGPFCLDSPLVVTWMLNHIQPPGYQPGNLIWLGQVNAYFMAGWIGLLITGLNMLPVSQLDGGHVTYALLGQRAHWIARGFMVIAIAYVVYANVVIWGLMIVLVLLLGADHPPTRDDRVQIGWFRTALGYISLLIPVLCFPPKGLIPFSQVLGLGP